MHLNDEELALAADGGATAKATRHLSTCEACRIEVTLLRLEPVMAERLTWALAGSADAGRIDHDMVADGMIAPETESRLLEMMRQSHEALFSNPPEALAIAESILEELAPAERSEDADHLTVLGMREKANALFRLGRFDEAIATVDEASGLAAGLPVSEYELAVLGYIRAAVDAERGNYPDALAGATSAMATLAMYGDDDRALSARILLAIVHFDSGNHEAALEAHDEILGMHGDELSPLTLATLHQNRGGCLVALGRFDEAEKPLRAAEQFYSSGGMHVESARVLWTRGLAAARANRPVESAVLLRKVAAAFDSLEMNYEAAAARLDLVEQFVASAQFADVARLAREIAEVFARVDARTRLAEALELLRDASTCEDVSTVIRAVESVRDELPAGHPLGLWPHA
jgi:tetratricopeptide (TPR) repeat protein